MSPCAAETGLAIQFARSVVLTCFVGLLAAAPAAASRLVTGNGFGFAVVDPESGAATKFYAHPYSFVRPDPANPLREGVETSMFIKELSWRDSGVHSGSAEYLDDSQVIHVQRDDGDGWCFMPFGLKRSALVIAW